MLAERDRILSKIQTTDAKDLSPFTRALEFALTHPDFARILGSSEVTDENLRWLGFTLKDLQDAGEALLSVEAEEYMAWLSALDNPITCDPDLF